MRLENVKTQRVGIEIDSFENAPTPEELGVPADAKRVLPWWNKKWNKELELFSFEYGYTYE